VEGFGSQRRASVIPPAVVVTSGLSLPARLVPGGRCGPGFRRPVGGLPGLFGTTRGEFGRVKGLALAAGRDTETGHCLLVAKAELGEGLVHPLMQ
jgi:hypothetical protein